MIDKDALRADCDCRGLAKWLGLEVVKMGSTEFIPCLSDPHHSIEGRNSRGKKKYTHNMVTHDGCYCFTCHERLDAISMVQRYHECYGGDASFMSACREIAEFLGNPSRYEVESKRKSFPYTNDDLQAFGISTDTRRSLSELFYEEPKMFSKLVNQVQEETEQKLLSLRTKLSNPVVISEIDDRIGVIEKEKGRSYI